MHARAAILPFEPEHLPGAGRLLAERGAAGIVIVGRNARRGKEIATEFTGAGTKTRYVQADLGKIDDVRKVMAEADKAFGRVDTLVNVAATTDRGTILNTSCELLMPRILISILLMGLN
jgi:hypothetical protein